MDITRFPTAMQQFEECGKVLNHTFPHQQCFEEAKQETERIKNEVERRTGLIIELKITRRPENFFAIMMGKKFGLDVHDTKLTLLSDASLRAPLHVIRTISPVIVPLEPKHCTEYYLPEESIMDPFYLQMFFTEEDKRFLDDIDRKIERGGDGK